MQRLQWYVQSLKTCRNSFLISLPEDASALHLSHVCVFQVFTKDTHSIFSRKTHSKCSRKTHIPSVHQRHTFQVFTKDTHSKCSQKTHIPSVHQRHTFQVSMKDTHSKCSRKTREEQFGFRAFSNSAPRHWDSLPLSLGKSNSSTAFQGSLKRHILSIDCQIVH